MVRDWALVGELGPRNPRVERDTGQLTWGVLLEEEKTVATWGRETGERERVCRGKRESV